MIWRAGAISAIAVFGAGYFLMEEMGPFLGEYYEMIWTLWSKPILYFCLALWFVLAWLIFRCLRAFTLHVMGRQLSHVEGSVRYGFNAAPGLRERIPE